MGSEYGFRYAGQCIEKVSKVKINRNICLIYLINIYYHRAVYILTRI